MMHNFNLSADFLCEYRKKKKNWRSVSGLVASCDHVKGDILASQPAVAVNLPKHITLLLIYIPHL